MIFLKLKILKFFFYKNKFFLQILFLQKQFFLQKQVFTKTSFYKKQFCFTKNFFYKTFTPKIFFYVGVSVKKTIIEMLKCPKYPFVPGHAMIPKRKEALQEIGMGMKNWSIPPPTPQKFIIFNLCFVLEYPFDDFCALRLGHVPHAHCASHSGVILLLESFMEMGMRKS